MLPFSALSGQYLALAQDVPPPGIPVPRTHRRVPPGTGKPIDANLPASTPAKTITISNGVLKWEPWGSFPPNTEYRNTAEALPPYTLTLTARVEHTDERNLLESVYLMSPAGYRMQGTSLRNFVGGPDERKWIWNGRDYPDPRWTEWSFEFDAFSRSGVPTAEVEARKEKVEWSDIAVDGAVGSETPLGRAQTEKTTASGAKVWLESVKIKEGRQGTSLSLFGRWLPPANDPSMRAKIEIADDWQTRTEGVSFDVGEVGRSPMVANGRQDGRADDTPGWFTISLSRPEGAHRLSLKLSLDPSSPLKAPVNPREKISLKVAPPATPAAIPTDLKPVAVQPLGKGQLQLFPTELRPENSWKWSWRAPLFLSLPPDAIDGTQWQDTGEMFGNMSTGLRLHVPWKVDGTPLGIGEVARDGFYNYSASEEKPPPAQGDLTTTWDRVKNETFSPRFANIPIPVPGMPITSNLSQPLGEWGTLVLKKVASFGVDETLSPRMKERAVKMFPMGGIALVFEQVPAQGKTDSWYIARNYANWNIEIDECHDSNKYPLLRVSDNSDGRHLEARDELTTADTKPADERRITIYVLPPTPGARTFDVTLQVRHRAVLETQKVTFPAVVLPTQ